MSKKKTINRKHKFKHVEPGAGGVTSADTNFDANSDSSVQGPAAAARLQWGAYSYVVKDVRRIIILAGFLVLLELITWYALGNFSFLKGIAK